jgi:hypothetical protein
MLPSATTTPLDFAVAPAAAPPVDAVDALAALDEAAALPLLLAAEVFVLSATSTVAVELTTCVPPASFVLVLTTWEVEAPVTFA